MYSDSSKGLYTKYVNLHLGLAYERMSEEDYHAISGKGMSNGKYVKPSSFNLDHAIFPAMIEQGIYALDDAFSAIKAKGLFNIFNSRDRKIEEFNESNARFYSQAQCAIVIERVFSGLYRYLQFKSTVGEKSLRHINIDNGYKYLSPETVLKSENPNSKSYYSNDDQVPYLRYLAKVEQYLSDGSDVLNADEKNVLR